MRSWVVSLSLILVAMLSIQYGASVAKGFFPIAGPAAVTALRVGFSALLMALVSRVWRLRLTRQQWQPLIAYGVSLGVMNLLFYFSLQRIPLGIAVAVEFVGPLGVALYASKKIRDGLWIVFAAFGLYLLLPLNSSEVASLDALGLALALGAGFFWGLYIIFGKMVSSHVESLRVSAAGMIVATMVTLPVGLYLSADKVLDVSLWPLGLVIAVLSSAIPYSFEMIAMKGIPTKTFGVLMSLEPVIAIMVGLLFLKETLTVTQGLAIALIVIASAGSAATAGAEAAK